MLSPTRICASGEARGLLVQHSARSKTQRIGGPISEAQVAQRRVTSVNKAWRASGGQRESPSCPGSP